MPRDAAPHKACCLISEVLAEAGLDRERARQLRRQVLHGIIQLCQWQLERLEASGAGGTPSSDRSGRRKARKVALD
jgi:hypothetical protein